MPRKKKVSASPNTAHLVSRAALFTVEVIGLAIAVYLTLISMRWIYDGEVPCLRSKFFACESVVRGMFSKIGPFSIAVLGAAYFAVQLLLTSILNRGRWAVVLKVLAVFAGLFFVAWLRSLELVYLKKICPWCLGVAFMVLIQTALVWPLAVPPLPLLRWPGRILAALTLLFAFLGLTSTIELLFKPSSGGTNRFFGWKPAEPEMDPDDEAEEEPAGSVKKDTKGSEKRSTAKTPKPAKTPRAVAQATPAPARTPALTRRPTPTPEAGDSLYTYTPTPAPTAPPAPRPVQSPPPAADEPEPPIDLPDVAELQMMQQRGWRMVGTTERAEQLITSRGPVLLMVYDPFCEECHATMRGLNADEVDRLPVTRVAIDQSSLTGAISTHATHVPTLLLISRDGQVLWKHEARIKAKKLVEEVTSRL